MVRFVARDISTLKYLYKSTVSGSIATAQRHKNYLSDVEFTEDEKAKIIEDALRLLHKIRCESY